MVGTAKWLPEWVAHVFECKKRGTMDHEEIAESLSKHFPRTKNFNAGGVKYVLQKWIDPTLPNDQTQNGGIKKKKKKPAKASQPLAGLQIALNQEFVGSPAISVASSLDPTTQTRRRVVGGRQNMACFDNPRPINMLPFANLPTPDPMQGDSMASMEHPYALPGSQAYPEGSFTRQGDRYPVATTAGASNENPFTIDDDGNDVTRQNMQRSSTIQPNAIMGQVREQPGMMNPYKMDANSLQQYRQQNGYIPFQTGQKHPTLNSQIPVFMEEQSQSVRGGISNASHVGLGLASHFSSASSTLQNVYPQSYKQTASQGSAQPYQTFHGLPSANSPSVYQSFGGSMATGNASVNHGLPNMSKPVSATNSYGQSGQRATHQEMFGAQDTQTMMGNVNDMTSMGRKNTNTTTGSRPSTTPKKSFGGQNMQPPSSSKARRAPDAFDFSAAESSFPDDHLFGGMSNPHPSSASVPQFQSYTQNGGKRKRQEEESTRIQMLAGAGEGNNGDRQINPPKRQKQDNSDKTMVGVSGGQGSNVEATSQSFVQDVARNGGDTRRTPQKQSMQPSQGTPQRLPSNSGLQSRPQCMQNSTAAAGSVQTPRVIDVGSWEQGYSASILKALRSLKDSETLHSKHEAFRQILSTRQGFSTPLQEYCAELYRQQLSEQSGIMAHVANSQISMRPQRSGEHAEGSRLSGMPHSAMSLPEQEEQHRLLQEKVFMGNNRGSAGATIMEQTGASQRLSGQQTARQAVGNNSTNIQCSSQPTPSNINGASAPPTFQATPYMNRADASDSQNGRVAGHRFDGPPIPQPTPNMNRPATSTSQQFRVSGNGAAAVPNPHFPANFNRPMSAPQQAQSNGNGANAIQTPAEYQPNPNNGRPSTAPSVTASQAPTSPAGGNAMQFSTPQQASVPMRKSTSLPAPNTRPSMNPRSGSIQPPQYQQGQGQIMNHEAQVFSGQQAPFILSRASTPSTANGPYQSPYPPSAEFGSIATTSQHQIHDQPLHQAANGAVNGSTSAAVQDSSAKTPSPGSKLGAGAYQSSSPPTVSPSTGSDGADSDIRMIHGIPIDVKNVNMVEVMNPVFHQHFTFPTARDGWNVMLDHANQQHKLIQGNNVIIITGAQFLGGVTWPQMSNQTVTGTPSAAAATRSKTSAPKPRRKAPAKKAPIPSSTSTASNTMGSGPAFQSHTATTSNTMVPAPLNPPLFPGQKPISIAMVPAPLHPPLFPGQKPNFTPSTSNTPNASDPAAPINVQNKKPDFHLDLKDVSPKTSMRKAGPVEKQTEPGFPELFGKENGDGDELYKEMYEELFGEGANDSAPSASAHLEDQTHVVEEDGDVNGPHDDLFGEGPEDDENVPAPSASAHSGDQTLNPSSNSTLPNPAVPSNSPQPAVGDDQQGGEEQSFLDKAQPTVQESLAPKSILSHLKDTQQPSNPNQVSSEASSRHVRFEEPKPAEEDILTDANAAEWRARHPIPKMPSFTYKAPPRRRGPSLESKKAEEPEKPEEPAKILTPEEEAKAIKSQEEWLQDIFPDYPLLTRLDVKCVDRPEIDDTYSHLPTFSLWDGDDTEEMKMYRRPGTEDYSDHGIPEVRAALDMLAYVRRWGELCTQFDEAGKPIITSRPDPSRKAFNEKMRAELAGNGPMSKKATTDRWFLKPYDEQYKVYLAEKAARGEVEEEKEKVEMPTKADRGAVIQNFFEGYF